MKTTRMWKEVFLLGVFTVMVTFSVSAKDKHWDASIPKEKEAKITIVRGGYNVNVITSFDGEQVNWIVAGAPIKVFIPAGSHTLTGNRMGPGAGYAKDAKITYDFLAQHTYVIDIEDEKIIVTDKTKTKK
ncbi:MAG: hypothetical protein Ta2G_07490 [Termitinemataceae bacterium]|nr:MAG: hypothetical protein Ta2G_07490 [Termitinemataceae bacterium]